MRLSNCPSPYPCSVWRRNSIVPYLFGGLAFIFLLISLALLILACTHCRKISRNSSPMSRNGTMILREVPNQIDVMAATEPKIVVIMAGDDKPSYLAIPSLG
ncbi:unnamed protein product [Withania somnifera]